MLTEQVYSLIVLTAIITGNLTSAPGLHQRPLLQSIDLKVTEWVKVDWAK